ncbi:MAG: hypothetical protein ACI4V5_02645 [Prevotella sp.]
MTRLVFIIILVALSHHSYAQVTSVICDMETKLPISNVKVFVNPRGLIHTDKFGRLFIYGKCDGATFTHVNYESRSMSYSAMRDTIWLMPKMNTLDEVVITAARPRIKFSIIKSVQKSTSGMKSPSGIDFLGWLDRSQKHKSPEQMAKFKKMLDNY